MNVELDKIVIDKIFDKIPSDVNPIEYLIKVLNLSRKSVYRRKSGEFSFSFEEIVILANELDFSIDELVAKSDMNQAIFSHKTDALFDPKDTFVLMLEKYYDFYRKASEAKSIESAFTMNNIVLIFFLDSTHLFKFFYYMWIHQGHNVPVNIRYADMVIPLEVISLSRKIWEYARYVHNTTIIADELIFKNLFKDIEYYYKRGLLTKEEFINLKDELLAYIKKLESIISLGTNEFQSTYRIYLSKLSIESNSSYFKIDEDEISSFWVFGISPIYTNNKTVFGAHKKWVDSLKKYSVLISQSNESLQSEFLNEQYKFVIESSDKLLQN